MRLHRDPPCRLVAGRVTSLDQRSEFHAGLFLQLLWRLVRVHFHLRTWCCHKRTLRRVTGWPCIVWPFALALPAGLVHGAAALAPLGRCTGRLSGLPPRCGVANLCYRTPAEDACRRLGTAKP